MALSLLIWLIVARVALAEASLQEEIMFGGAKRTHSVFEDSAVASNSPPFEKHLVVMGHHPLHYHFSLLVLESLLHVFMGGYVDVPFQ